MKKLYFLFSALFVTSLTFGQQINEFEPNPLGGDPANVDVELKGTPNAAFDLWLISIENDGAQGIVDRATNVTGTFGTNGLALVSIPDLENPSFTFVLSTDFTGAVTDDLDATDDGTIDDPATVFGTVLDAVGISDNAGDDGTLYAAGLGGTNINYNGITEPELAFRDGTTGDWFVVVWDFSNTIYLVFDTSGSEVTGGSFDSDPTAGNSFGDPNPSFALASTKENQIDGFELYPNPTSEAFITISSDKRSPMKVSVFDILGKQVVQRTITDNRLNVSNLNTGVYILRAEQDNAFTTRKLIIN